MRRRNFLKGMFTLPMVVNYMFANESTQKSNLDIVTTILKNDTSLNKRVSSKDIEEAIEYAKSMNRIILEAIDTITVTDNKISVQNIKDISNYIYSNYKDSWALLHGKNENGNRSGFHKVVKAGAKTEIFNKNAINKVFHGIYHLGFNSPYKKRLVDESGKKSVTTQNVAKWLTSLLFENSIQPTQEKKDNSNTDLKILIPLYSYPTSRDKDGNLIWDRLIKLKESYSNIEIIAIVNPQNGDFESADSNYKEGIKKLTEANIKVVGYIYTNYANRNIEDIYKNINAWREEYREDGVDGIFFDEVSDSTNDLEYYNSILSYAKESFSIGILNPGDTTAQEYIDGGDADIVVTLEDTQQRVLENPPSSYNTSTKTTQLGILVYKLADDDIETLLSFAKEHDFSYIYFTDDGFDGNPWDSISTYLEDTLEAL